jgi:hypothetical protein
MSKEAVASVYAMMLTDVEFREEIAANPEVLGVWELTDDERKVLLQESGAEVSGFAIGSGPVMSFLSGPSGPPLSGPSASSLGIALNKAGGLPTTALNGPGFVADAGCCPWGHGFVADGAISE